MEDQFEMYSFEYNEKDGILHQNFGNSIENTHGYKTVCKARESFWYPFSNMLKRRYDFDSEKRPSFDVVQKEWDEYLLLLQDINNYRDF